MRVAGQEALLHKLVFELRYIHGWNYLDHCGATINRIQSEQPEWLMQDANISPQGAPLISASNGAVFSFSVSRVILSLERASGAAALDSDDVDAFASQAEFLSSLVIDQLGLREFTRIGFRVWHLFGFSDKESSEKWLQSLGCYSVGDRLAAAFSSAPHSTSFIAVFEGEERMFRASFNGVEIQERVPIDKSALQIKPRALHKGQKAHLRKQMKVKKLLEQNPQFAAMIDIDSYLDEPENFDVCDFISTSIENLQGILTKLGGS